MIHTLSLIRQYVRATNPDLPTIIAAARKDAVDYFSPLYPDNCLEIQVSASVKSEEAFMDVYITVTYDTEKDVASVNKPEPIPGGKVYEVSATGLRPV
jgi:hypothetical protein